MEIALLSLNTNLQMRNHPTQAKGRGAQAGGRVTLTGVWQQN